MNKVIVSCCFLLFCLSASSQSWQWARRAGATGDGVTDKDGVYDMKVDKNGNTYALVVFDNGIRNIATSNNTIDDTFPTVIGGQDVGIISYDKCGKLRWYKIMGGLGDDIPMNLGLDTINGVYAVFMNNLDNQIGNITIPNPKRKGFGIVKLDTAGVFQWFRQPNADTNSISKNFTYGYPISSYTETNGDTYIFCGLGTGLVSGSTNLVVTTPHHYVLKYNSSGVPTELIKMDMSDSIPFSLPPATQFVRTKSGKFFICSQIDYSYLTNPVYLGTTQISKPVLVCCYSPTGQFVWKIEDVNASFGGLHILWNESQKRLYFGGGLKKNDSFNGYTITNAPGYTGYFLPVVGCLDTLGNTIWIKNGYAQYNGGECYIGAITSNNILYGGGGIIGAIDWGNGISWNPNSVTQGYITGFDANTGTAISIDTVRGNGITSVLVYGSDSSNNVYIGGYFATDVSIGNQNLSSIGGVNDFFIAKYGANNCGTTPLRFMNYNLQLKTGNKGLIENYWTTSNEINVSRFNVQRSINGKNFTTIGTVLATNKSLNEYRFDDNLTPASPKGEELYYRIESVDFNGETNYSQTRNINIEIKDNELLIYPNPIKDVVNIECKEGIKDVKVFNYLGMQIATGKNLRNDGTNQHYQLQIINYQKVFM